MPEAVESIDKGSVSLKRNTLTKADRIRNAEAFRTLSRKGKRYYSDHLLLVARKNQCAGSRLGLTVSKRVGNAVQRNRIKRIIREYFRLNRCLLPGRLDINIIAKRSAGKVGVEKIRENLAETFKKMAATVENRDDQ